MRTWRAGTSSEEGFTLVEFVFVVFILAIFFGLALPRIRQGVSPDPLRVGSTNLAESIRRVRDHAVSEGQLLRLRVRFPDGEWKVEAITTEGKWLELADSPVKKGRFPVGVRLLKVRIAGKTDIVTGEAYLRFLPTGETPKSFLYLSDSGRNERTLLVHPFINNVEIRHGRIQFQS